MALTVGQSVVTLTAPVLIDGTPLPPRPSLFGSPERYVALASIMEGLANKPVASSSATPVLKPAAPPPPAKSAADLLIAQFGYEIRP